MSTDALKQSTTPNYGSASDERQAIMERSQGPKKRPIDELEEHGPRKVHDPVTGGSVRIADAVGVQHEEAVGNILYRPFPPSAELELQPILSAIDKLIMSVPVVTVGLIVFSGFRLWNVAGLTACTVAAVWSLGSIRTRISRECDRARVAIFADRAASIQPPTPESTVWLNAFLTSFWPLIDPALFISTIDMVEDIMQQSVPKFIDAVRISDFGLGTNALQIISMRALPNEGAELDRSDGADYVNLEVAFNYLAKPGKSQRSKANNIHMLLEMFAGVSDWLRVPIRIWAQVEKISGAARIRLKMTQNFPYVSEVTYTLLGIPELDISVFPLSKKMPDVLDLPMLRGFVRSSVAAGCQAFVAPSSGTVDLASIMSPTRIGDTHALGIFMITVHEARDLHGKDIRGKSDPYIVLAYAKFGKPAYSTRVIEKELNPSFEETAFMLLTQNEVDAEEELSAMLWDSDKTSDDLLGRAKIPVVELMKTPNVMHRREDKLKGFEDSEQKQGTIIWSIGYFEKLPLNKKLEHPPPDSQPKVENGKPVDGQQPQPQPQIQDNQPADVLRTPPDREFPSGVLHITLHQVFGLERQAPRGNMGGIDGQESRTGQDKGKPEEEGDDLPSAYCELIVNDDLVYKTRVKQFTSMPFFEAGTEVFVRDWTKAKIRVVVRDAVLRERDPILGIVTLDLAQVLAQSSEKTGLYPLQDGIGFGRASVSILFKSVKLELGQTLRGWDTATVEISPEPITLNLTTTDKNKFKRLVISTLDAKEKFDKLVADNTWQAAQMVRLPVYTRFATALEIKLYEGGGLDFMDKKPEAVALLWLKDIEDDNLRELELPVYGGHEDRINILKENVVTDSYRERHQGDFTQIGTIKIKVRVDPGLDLGHSGFARSDARRSAFESYHRAEGLEELTAAGAESGDKEAMEEAHKRQRENRQQGMHQFKPVRTMDWMAHSLKSKLKGDSSPTRREPNVHDEGET
ncbi:hypothetical protein BKA62DRAFT_716123 [Auriculariales sp. MPI-PUGE-AT-0066]|nr:hypothetical protein BKA62DRAFT_716123 [Auriculariales sp. MPI-PUGE-AT-0066]